MKTTLQATAVVLATTAGLLTTVAVPTASAATTCASPVFKRQLFANTTFKGTPKKTACDSAIDESWSGAPASGLPKDNFGVRWSVTRDFGSGGPFALAASGLDGIRVYLDGVRKIDLWKNTTKTVTKTVNVTVPKGKHTLRVDYVNWTGAAKVKFTYTPRTSAGVDKVRPLTPLAPLVSYDGNANTTKLSWAKNREMDLAGYRVYRRPRGSTGWTKVGTTASTSLTDAPPATGALYYYEIRAYDKAGNESAGTADAPVTSAVLQTPARFTVSATDTGAELSWSGVRAAVKYRVERTDFHGVVTKSWELAHTVSLTDGTLTRGETVKYRVAAVDGSGHASPFTDLKAVTRPLAAPRGLTATAGIGSATLQWTMRAADTPYGEFRVYRSTTLPVDTSTAQWVTCTTSYTTLSDGSRRYSCGDFSAEEGTTYHYAVANVQWPQVSPLSGTATVTTLASDKPPAQVTGLTATATEYGIELDWDDNTEADLNRYVVYRGTVLGEEGDEQVCSGSEWAWLSPSTSRYRDVRLPDGDHACYWVDAIDTAGNSSRWLGPVSAVAVDELDLTPSVATPEGSPLTLTADTPDSGGVHLAWSAVDSATGYQVYRWNPATRTYEKLAATADRSYDDATAARGTTHHYWVTALYADGTESAPGAEWAILEP
ncbi:PA14 domain-containing protein [Streptomyces sp. Ag109_O5-10]|uniref:PA14 domain-containing protein n=1 Tax=Streptomyces sp. Ag109_O5-10 TaxID=1855349 RepID=UPI000896265F|nr:PA14 domain-containing protein [Streptomyces sp. Ag109_O5-10]SEE85936.1 PA14 domain-containing protein [Streptomyces sp. Ag109_O5-10]